MQASVWGYEAGDLDDEELQKMIESVTEREPQKPRKQPARESTPDKRG